MSRLNYSTSSAIFAIILFFSSHSFSQANNPLSEEFLAGLPPSVADELMLNNAVKKEEELEKLFRADTEFIKSKDILEKIRYELKSIEKRIDKAEGREKAYKDLVKIFLVLFNHLLCL